jgi:hypothetical protein
VKFTQKAFLFASIVSASFGVSAEQYTNGWTEGTFKSTVNGCVATAVSKQMQFMSSSGQIKPGASPSQMAAAQAQVTSIETTICTCVQQQIMRDIKFENVESIRQRPDYVRQVGARCANEAMKNRN